MQASGSESVVNLSFCESNKEINKLFSFVCLKQNSKISEQEIISRCKAKLPWYMIPEKIFIIDEMPLNKNRKIDKQKLIEKYLK